MPPWTAESAAYGGPSDWTLVAQIGPRHFPAKTLQQIFDMCTEDPSLLERFRAEYNGLPFFAFKKACESGTSLGRIFTVAPKVSSAASASKAPASTAAPVAAKPRPKKAKKIVEDDDAILNAAILENKQRSIIEAQRLDLIEKQRLEALKAKALARQANADTFLKSQKALAEEVKQCTSDYEMLRNFPKMCLVETHKLPNALGLFLYLQCISVRESLMRAVVYTFSEWASEADLPTYDTVRPFFQNRKLFDTVPPIKAMCKIIQVARSILAACFGLRSRLLPKHFGETPKSAFVYNVAAQNMYKDTYFREHSLCVLEGIQVLGASAKLIQFYEAVEQFESFYCGVDFPTFRLAFALPDLKLPGILIKNASLTMDYIHAHQMSGFEPTDLSRSWQSYYDKLRPLYKTLQALWDSNMLKLGFWLDTEEASSAEMPTIESLEAPSDFVELFDIYFGTLKPECATKTTTTIMNALFDIINKCAFETFSKKQDSLTMDEAVLNFLLSKDLFKWSKAYTYGPHLLHKFPFAPTLQERWLMCKHYKAKDILRAQDLLELANKLKLS